MVIANPHKPRIFLSSTYVDLVETRKEIIQWLEGIFRTELIIMETFGSDADPPDIHSVKRVRECDLFIGIYAHRYGTIDKDSGKSITELEFDEARAAFSTGILKDILLYIIEENENWLIEHKEGNQVGQIGLKRLKDKASQHTYTPFKSKENLLFSIIRDVYRKSNEHFATKPTTVRPFQLPSPKSIRQPIGMEFLTSEHRDYLFGRHQIVNQLLERLKQDPFVLLLGDSGVGKTSLIHAGLFPKVTRSGFRPIYTRPFGLPHGDIVRQIQTAVFEGRPPERSFLVPLLAEVSAAFKDEKVLLIIDQFEDVLTARENLETEKLVSELRAIRELGPQSISVLIIYRADLEGRLGEYWQKISGSPQGLPRMYVGGIDKKEAWESIKQVCSDLSINIDLRDTGQKRLMEDLFIASKSFGQLDVYPPYIQMLVDHIWASSKKGKIKYNLKHYQETGGMEGVIGGYLARQLEYAQDSEGHVRVVLISLVRSYGVKAQKTIDDIVQDTGFSRQDCEIALEKLINLRLVRHIDTYYEISHDFLARKIMLELVDSEEREFKQSRELLSTKAAAFQTTRTPLSPEELLLLFKHRNRIVPDAGELRLILRSWLQEVGPALYWLLDFDKARIIDWLKAEESKDSLTRDEKILIILLRRKLGEKELVTDDFSVFGGYQLASELSYLILEEALKASKELLRYGLMHARAEVKEASTNALALQIKSGRIEWIEILRNSGSLRLNQTYRDLVLRDDVPTLEKEKCQTKSLKEFKLLKEISLAQTRSEVQRLFEELKKTRPPLRNMLFGKALAYNRQGRIKQLLNEVSRVSAENAQILLSGIDKKISDNEFGLLIAEYEKWNSKEKDFEKPAIFTKANACAVAILNSASGDRLHFVRDAMSKIHLTRSSRYIVLTILIYGEIDDIKGVLNRIASENNNIVYWNHTELGIAVVKRLRKIGGGIPKFLKDIYNKKEFWDYIHHDERKSVPKSELLPIKQLNNRALYIRLSAYAMIGMAEKKDQACLLNLTTHGYGLISRAAVKRLVGLLKEGTLDLLCADVDISIRTGKSRSLADVLRWAELELYGITSLWKNN